MVFGDFNRVTSLISDTRAKWLPNGVARSAGLSVKHILPQIHPLKFTSKHVTWDGYPRPGGGLASMILTTTISCCQLSTDRRRNQIQGRLASSFLWEHFSSLCLGVLKYQVKFAGRAAPRFTASNPSASSSGCEKSNCQSFAWRSRLQRHWEENKRTTWPPALTLIGSSAVT